MSSSTCSSTATGLQTDRKPWKHQHSDQHDNGAAALTIALHAHVILCSIHQGLDSTDAAKSWLIEFLQFSVFLAVKNLPRTKEEKEMWQTTKDTTLSSKADIFRRLQK